VFFFRLELVLSWDKLLNWSERRIIINQFRNETAELQAIIDDMGVKSYTFTTDTEIQNAVDELKVCCLAKKILIYNLITRGKSANFRKFLSCAQASILRHPHAVGGNLSGKIHK
jgi:hypothetical protein